MTALRRRMIEDMRVRNLAANTQRVYVQYVRAFARHFGRSPEQLGPEEIRAWQVNLVEAGRAGSTLMVATAALRFLYNVTLRRGWTIDEIATSKVPRTLPVILSPDEVMRFFESIRSVKYRAILMTAYAGGLRISEATHLTVSDIDSQRMVLRVAQGKGQVDRYVMLSPRLLEILREYWRLGRPNTGCSPDASRISRSVPAYCGESARRLANAPASASPSRRMRCATRLLRTYSNPAPTCEPSSCCLVTAASPPRRAI